MTFSNKPHTERVDILHPQKTKGNYSIEFWFRCKIPVLDMLRGPGDVWWRSDCWASAGVSVVYTPNRWEISEGSFSQCLIAMFYSALPPFLLIRWTWYDLARSLYISPFICLPALRCFWEKFPGTGISQDHILLEKTIWETGEPWAV